MEVYDCMEVYDDSDAGELVLLAPRSERELQREGYT